MLQENVSVKKKNKKNPNLFLKPLYNDMIMNHTEQDLTIPRNIQGQDGQGLE